VSKSIKGNIKEVAQNACYSLQQKLLHDVRNKAELDLKCFCFYEFPERLFELAAKLQTEKLKNR
jgi:hypothetical protein